MSDISNPNNMEDKKEDQNDIKARHLFVLKEPQGDPNDAKGENPTSIQECYNFDKRYMGQGQTIAIVGAFDYPTARHDLDVFSRQFRLPRANLEIIYARGHRPPLDAGWAMESALDIQWAHAFAPRAKILLVLSYSNNFTDLFQAVDVAVQHGAQVVSMSWGGYEFSGETSYDRHFQHEGVTFVAGAGYLDGNTLYPSVSQFVLSVGGIKINRNNLGEFVSETGWSNGKGGPAIYVPIPFHQAMMIEVAAKCGNNRGTPDVAFYADPASAVAIYDSTPYNGFLGWTTIGGASLAAPCWTAIIACINGQRIKPIKNAMEFLYLAACRNSYTNQCYWLEWLYDNREMY